MNNEDFFISLFENNNIIGDDGAVIGSNVYSMDAFFENVHFKKEWMSLKQIAYKSMIVNISDAIVMNAVPKYALLSVAIPKDYSKKDMQDLAAGFNKAAKKFGIQIIGGDTISNEKLDISITVISKTKNPIYRTGAKKGDIVCYTNELGSCKKDLQKLFDGKSISKKSKFIKPKLNPDFFYEASKYINCSLDISDGLGFELQRVSKASKVGFEFFENISNDILSSGEEYEVLFTFNPKHEKKLLKIANKHKVKLNFIAKVIDGSYESNLKNHHFKN